MKLRLSLTLLLLIMLAACSSPQPTAPASAPAVAPTTAPEVKPTSVPPTQPAGCRAADKHLRFNGDKASATLSRRRRILRRPLRRQHKSRPPTTSAGPLSAAIYPANCRSAPTADKPGRVIVQISVEASGGNGRYRYFNQDKESPTKFIEVIGEKGTRLIGEVKVTSGDGQEIKKEFDIAINQLTCP